MRLTDVTLTVGETTREYAVSEQQGTLFRFVDKSGTVANSTGVFSLEQRFGAANSNRKVTMLLTDPVVVKDASGADMTVKANASITFSLPKTYPNSHITKLRQTLIAWLSQQCVSDPVDSGLNNY